MHIILGALGLVVTILVLLKRLQDGGIDIGWLNPFSWMRRRKFRKQYEASPVYTLESPMDVAALFLVAIAKTDGEMSKEQKARILQLFETEFKLSHKEAKSLLGSSVHLYGRGDEVTSKLEAVIARSRESFSKDNVESVKYMLGEVSKAEGEATPEQYKLIKEIEAVLPKFETTKW
jgi:uncharacterized tellurite resistance protein B-like protein